MPDRLELTALPAQVYRMNEKSASPQIGQCGLCNQLETLRVSHVIPAFVFRWLKETSATGHIRSVLDVNQRIQDGHKKPWLCGDCEVLFARVERQFSSKLFHPQLNGVHSIDYGEWLQRFCVSVSWRVLCHCKGLNTDHEYTEQQERAASKAKRIWADFLLGQRSSLGGFDQHFLPLDIIEDTTVPDLPDNINRFLTRNVEMDIIGGAGTFMTYAKLGRFVIFGMMQRPRGWDGTRVFGSKGRIAPRTYSLPASLMHFFKDRARLSKEAIAQMSPRQAEKVDATVLANIDRFINSEQMRAMKADAAMFGEQAIVRREPKADG